MNQQLQLGIQYCQSGQLQQAEVCFREVLQSQPNCADAWHFLGVIASQQTQYFTAIDRIERAIKLKPNVADFYMSLGEVYQKQHRFNEAIQTYQKALQLEPQLAQAYNHLGIVYKQQGQLETAIAQYQQAIQLQPQDASVHFNLSAAYIQSGQLELAKASCQQVIQLQPDNPDVYDLLAIILQKQDKPDEAIASYQRLLQINPHSAEAQNDLGTVLERQGNLEQAIQAYQQAIQLNPTLVGSYINLGNVLKEQSKLAEALQVYQYAAQLNPNHEVLQHNFLLSLYYSHQYQPAQIYAAHRQWGDLITSLTPKSVLLHNNDRNPERRLRIGYVSGDFRTHAVTFFFEPLLATHNCCNFEVICYANNERVDHKTQQLRQLADGWREIYALTHEQVAQLIHQDKIDILIDLSGHTGDNRLLAFAYQPAPIQVTYLGYPGTTGLPAIDYRITDAWVDPVGQTEDLHTETLIRLPHNFLCYQPPEDAPSVSPLPALKKKYITFGSFNKLTKLSPPLINYWSQILQAVPHSHLLLKSKGLYDINTRNYVRSLLQQQGIEAERLELMGWSFDHWEQLSCYQYMDIALDTFPYHGTTTTCEALWMGVPVISLAGESHVSRVGVSLLHTVGLEDLIAQSPEEYVQKAVTLAHDLQELQTLRITLRDRMQNSSLMNPQLVVQSLESHYRQIWRHWCSTAG